MARFRDNNLRVIVHDKWVWLVQVIAYVAIIISLLMLPSKKRVVRSICYVDVTMFINMMIVQYYWLQREDTIEAIATKLNTRSDMIVVEKGARLNKTHATHFKEFVHGDG